MFPFINKTWNPLGGNCGYGCVYCWARALCGRLGMKKYRGKPSLDSPFRVKFKPGDFVFVQDMTDLFHPSVPDAFIDCVLGYMYREPAVRFLLLTKNPERMKKFLFPENVVLGATVESNGWTVKRGSFYQKYSSAPDPSERIDALYDLCSMGYENLFVSVEPIMDFDLEIFLGGLQTTFARTIAVGYDNYRNMLPEPSLEKTRQLINGLQKSNVKVIVKTLREAWRLEE